MLPNNFISNLEKAVAARSDDIGTMLHQITDLFLLNAGHYSADQVKLYDDVLQILIAKVDVAARATLAERLASVDGAPFNTTRSLALDDAIEVAEPILTRSNVLDDDTLFNCITQGQEHVLAIATRSKVGERVSDQLVINGDKKVLDALVSNAGAEISDLGFKMPIQKSVGDDWLSEAIASRPDIPEHHFQDLVSKASEIVRLRLMLDNPEQQQIIEEIFAPNPASPAPNKTSRSKDYRTAELVVNSRPLTEAAVNEFAKARQLDEVVVAIAQLSDLPRTDIEKLFIGAWSSPVAVILKAIGFHLVTIDTLYRARLSTNEPVRDDLTRTKAEFIAFSRPTAERIMRFYRTRKSVEFTEKP